MFAELGDVINGVKPALREKTTVFKSLGEFLRKDGGCRTRRSRLFLQEWAFRTPRPLSWCSSGGKPKLANAEANIFNKINKPHSRSLFA